MHARVGWAEAHQGSEGVQPSEHDRDGDSSSNAMAQLQIAERLDTIDMSQIEEDGRHLHQEPKTDVEQRVRRRSFAQRDEPRVNEERPRGPANVKHHQVSDKRSECGSRPCRRLSFSGRQLFQPFQDEWRSGMKTFLRSGRRKRTGRPAGPIPSSMPCRRPTSRCEQRNPCWSTSRSCPPLL